MLKWFRILFYVLIGRETTQTHAAGGRKDVERVGEEMLRRQRADRAHLTRPIRLYGQTANGTKVHIRLVKNREPVFLCGAKPDVRPFSSVPPVDETELCYLCVARAKKEAE